MEGTPSTCDNHLNGNDCWSECDQSDSNELDRNPRLADALNKVLRMAKKKNGNKSIILSKAKLYNINKEIKKEICGFEIEPSPSGEVLALKEQEDPKPDIKLEKKKLEKNGLNRLTKHEILKRGRVIPSVLDREKERLLSRIATRGVVQLFNAVRHQQTSIENQFKGKKLTEVKREKILKSIDRKAFLNALSGTVNISSHLDNNENGEKAEVKEEEEDNENDQPPWEVLRNDFMMGAKLKDWDKKEDEDDEVDKE